MSFDPRLSRILRGVNAGWPRPASWTPVERLPAMPGMPHGPGFMRRHVAWPLLAFLVLATAAMAGGGDAWLADRLYAWEGGRWALRDAWLAQRAIHQGGRDLSALMWLATLVAWRVACLREDGVRLRRPLGYLLVATAAAAAVVSLLKGVTGVDCPWDLARYGGRLPMPGPFAARASGLPAAGCFPAGHASGGYAWMAMYFFLRVVRPRARFAGLALGVGMGLVFGVAQQLRGAHFLSHDAWTAAICWFVALGLYLAFWPSSRASAAEAA